MEPIKREARRVATATVRSMVTLAALLALSGGLLAQLPGTSGPPSSGTDELPVAVQAQQQLSQPGPPVSPNSTANPSNVDQNFKGSLTEGKATDGVLPLSLDEAMQRGLRTNLGLVLTSANARGQGGQRLVALQDLLPKVTGSASYTVEQVDLAAYGLKFPGINPIIGPFQVIDFRAYLTDDLVNLESFQKYMAAKHNFESAKLSAQDARDLVVLTVGNQYLVCVADKSRIAAVEAELASSKVSLDQATDAHEAGTSPRLDVLRAQVDYQSEQQTLISAQNSLEKDKLALARAIGLPLDQKFEVTDTEPFQALDAPDPNAALQQALKQRKDLAAAVENTKAAEAQKKAAFDDQLPTAKVTGNFGDLGETPNHSHGTYTAEGEIDAPIFQVVKTRGNNEVAKAQLVQAQAKQSDQVQQVNQDVRDAILDIQTAAKLVDVAKSNVELAREALNEAQERFKAGVADQLPVSQALATDRQAEDQYIAALYQHNVAKLSLARALGVASTNYKDYLGGK
ncbi:TolC family protein [Granulicella sp. 5B5]|nr:TolC family protein [Granulicella sp. 5B5]